MVLVHVPCHNQRLLAQHHETLQKSFALTCTIDMQPSDAEPKCTKAC